MNSKNILNTSNTIPDGLDYGNYLLWNGTEWIPGGHNSIIIGNTTGIFQNSGAITIGRYTGATEQGINSISIGSGNGLGHAGNSIAIGNNVSCISSNSVAIGVNATIDQQFTINKPGLFCDAIKSSEDTNLVVFDSNGSKEISYNPTLSFLTQFLVSRIPISNKIPTTSGLKLNNPIKPYSNINLNDNSIAFGVNSGLTSQSFSSIAIGYSAGENNQKSGSIALGNLAGQLSQGINSIAIGNYAGQNNQPDNSIILNSSGLPLNPLNPGFYVNKIRTGPTGPNQLSLVWDSETNEIVAMTLPDGQNINTFWENIYGPAGIILMAGISSGSQELYAIYDKFTTILGDKHDVKGNFKKVSNFVSGVENLLKNELTPVAEEFKSFSNEIITDIHNDVLEPVTQTVISGVGSVISYILPVIVSAIPAISVALAPFTAGISLGINLLIPIASAIMGSNCSFSKFCNAIYLIGHEAYIGYQSNNIIGSIKGFFIGIFAAISGINLRAIANNSVINGINSTITDLQNNSEEAQDIIANVIDSSLDGTNLSTLGTLLNITRGYGSSAFGNRITQILKTAGYTYSILNLAFGNNLGMFSYHGLCLGAASILSAYASNTISIGIQNNAFGGLGILIGREAGSGSSILENFLHYSRISSLLEYIDDKILQINNDITNFGATGSSGPYQYLPLPAGLDGSMDLTNLNKNTGVLPDGTTVYGCISIGYQAGNSDQGSFCQAVGWQAGKISQGPLSIAYGTLAGNKNQGTLGIAYGNYAGVDNQGYAGFAHGHYAGAYNQGDFAQAIGYGAGCTSQGKFAIAVGPNAGCILQGCGAIALGREAGFSNQATNSMALGNFVSCSTPNSIAIGVNATKDKPFIAPRKGLFCDAVVETPNKNLLVFDENGFEISYNPIFSYQVQKVANRVPNAISTGFKLNVPESPIPPSTDIGPQPTNNSIGLEFQYYNTPWDGNIPITEFVSNNQPYIIENVKNTNNFTTSTNNSPSPSINGNAGIWNGFFKIPDGVTNIKLKLLATGAVAFWFGVSVATGATILLGTNGGSITSDSISVIPGRFYSLSGIANLFSTLTLNEKQIETLSQPTFSLEIIDNTPSKPAVSILGSYYNNCDSSIAVGNNAGLSQQGNYTLALGSQAGENNQSEWGIALGNKAGQYSQGYNSISIGSQAGQSNLGNNSIAIGNFAAQVSTSNNYFNNGIYFQIYNGYFNDAPYSGTLSFFDENISIPILSGFTNDLSSLLESVNNLPVPSNKFSILYTGYINSSTTASYTFNLSCNTQGYVWINPSQQNTITNATISSSNNVKSTSIVSLTSGNYIPFISVFGYIKDNTTPTYSLTYTVPPPGGIISYFNKLQGSISIGNQAGQNIPGQLGISIGSASGQNNQGSNTVAIGPFAGQYQQKTNAISIGSDSGKILQGLGSIAIGFKAGMLNQPENSIAIGQNATNNSANSISLNASPNSLDISDSGFNIIGGSSNFSSNSSGFNLTQGTNILKSNTNAVALTSGTYSLSSDTTGINLKSGSENNISLSNEGLSISNIQPLSSNITNAQALVYNSINKNVYYSTNTIINSSTSVSMGSTTITFSQQTTEPTNDLPILVYNKNNKTIQYTKAITHNEPTPQYPNGSTTIGGNSDGTIGLTSTEIIIITSTVFSGLVAAAYLFAESAGTSSAIGGAASLASETAPLVLGGQEGFIEMGNVGTQGPIIYSQDANLTGVVNRIGDALISGSENPILSYPQTLSYNNMKYNIKLVNFTGSHDIFELESMAVIYANVSVIDSEYTVKTLSIGNMTDFNLSAKGIAHALYQYDNSSVNFNNKTTIGNYYGSSITVADGSSKNGILYFGNSNPNDYQFTPKESDKMPIPPSDAYFAIIPVTPIIQGPSGSTGYLMATGYTGTSEKVSRLSTIETPENNINLSNVTIQGDSNLYTNYFLHYYNFNTGPTGLTGSTGDKGDKGDKGTTGPTGQRGPLMQYIFAGNWTENKRYPPGRIVYYNNNTYMSLTGPNFNKIPSSSTETWGLMATITGPTGCTGYTGYTGYTGPTGALQTFNFVGSWMSYTGSTTGPSGLTALSSDLYKGYYSLGNVVHYNNYNYISLIDNNTNNIPSTSAESWGLMSTLTGATGSKGEQGLIGPIGPKGDQGLIGPTGYTGPKGEQGLLGPIGPTGYTGPKGEQGLLGPIGPTGYTGPKGEQGLLGPIGPTGYTGPKGEQGSLGPAGPAGPAGPIGPAGSVGPIGPIGPAGPAGQRGDDLSIYSLVINPQLPVAGSCIGVSSSGEFQTVGCNDGNIYYLSNFGTEWSKASLNSLSTGFVPSSWVDISVSALGQYQTIISGTNNNSAFIYTSSDYGQNWTVYSAISATWVGISVSGSGKYQAALNTKYVYTSSDYGITWTQKDIYRLNNSDDFSCISMSITGQYQTITTISEDKYKSTDFGNTWQQIQFELGTTQPKRVYVSASGQYQSMVSLTTDSQGGQGGIHVSTDYGNTWPHIFAIPDSSTNPINWTSIIMSASGKYQVAYNTSDNYLYYSTTYGADNNWKQSIQTHTYSYINMSPSGKYIFGLNGTNVSVSLFNDIFGTSINF